MHGGIEAQKARKDPKSWEEVKEDARWDRGAEGQKRPEEVRRGWEEVKEDARWD